MAKFDDNLKREIIALDSRGLPEAEIIRQIQTKFGILKELVRKHLAGLGVLKDLERRSLPIPPELDGSDLLQRRFRTLRGTVTYLRNLSRLVDSLAGGGHPVPRRELDTLRQQVADLKEVQLRPALVAHWKRLFEPLHQLRALAPLSFRDFDLTQLDRRPTETRPIPHGTVRMDRDGNAVVEFAPVSWDRLQEHLPATPLWEHLEEARVKLQDDMAARLAMYRAVRARVEAELRLPVGGPPSVEFVGFVSDRYVFALHVAGLSHALGRTDWRRTEESFLVERPHWEQPVDPGALRDVLLDGSAVITGDEATVERAVGYFLKTQDELHTLPETARAAAAFHGAEKAVAEVRRELERIAVLPDVPGRCGDCPTWPER